MHVPATTAPALPTTLPTTNKSKLIPPGLARRELALPPGIQKRVDAGETPPPGIAKRFPAAAPTPEPVAPQTGSGTGAPIPSLDIVV
jgi:hypothetical protein